jgi:8-oxo-dGTP pyrophosphatase MutT (NUDIX family)
MNVEYKNNWFSVISTESGGNPFYYVKERDKVVILPYYIRDGVLQVITLIEPISIWGKKREITAVTGTIDKGESPYDSAPRELQEELGLVCEYSKVWTYLGEFHYNKGTQGTRHLFLVDVTGCKATPKSTDGSWFENNTKIMVSGVEDLILSTDLHLHYLLARLQEHLSESEEESDTSE